MQKTKIKKIGNKVC